MAEAKNGNGKNGTNGKRCSQAASCEPLLVYALRSTVDLWAASYCDGNYEECARYRLAIARQSVPENLLPNGRQLNPLI